MTPRASDKHIAGLIVLYKQSAAFTGLANSTRYQWGRWLDRINEIFGETSLTAMSAHGSKRLLTEWRDAYADRPRTADYGMQVMKRLLSWAHENEMIARNPAAEIGKLYDADLSEEIWEPAHLVAALKIAPPYVKHAIQLAAHTGLRVSDLFELTWDAVHDDEIRWKTRKSNRRITAVIPITRALRAVLGGIPRVGATILVNSRGAAWGAPGTLSKAIQAAAVEAGVERRTHDLRGTAATNLMIAGLNYVETARVLGWSVADVERIAARYVSQGAVSRGIAKRLDTFAVAGAHPDKSDT